VGLIKVDWVKDRQGHQVTGDPAVPSGTLLSLHPERVRILGAVARE
jgi:hypothetical protein